MLCGSGICAATLAPPLLGAQATESGRAVLSGTVADATGAMLPRAALHLQIQGKQVQGGQVQGEQVQGEGTPLDGHTDSLGRFSFAAGPGTYTLRAESPGFALYESKPLTLRTGHSAVIDIRLTVAGQPEQVEVSGANTADSAGDALTFEGTTLNQLSNDNATLLQQLNALTGGFGTPQILVDGFSGGHLPPKSSIRSIRINSNSYSAYYDNFGFSRIEVATKPGADKLHGEFDLTGTDQPFNASNPYTGVQPPYYQFQSDSNVNGPLGKRTSFFASENIGILANNAVVNAVVLDPDFAPAALSEALPAPQRTDIYALRVDRQFGPNNFAYLRDEWSRTHVTNSGINPLVLPSAAFTSNVLTNTLQMADTQVLGPHAVNEARFQYLRTRLSQNPNSTDPALLVQGAFVGGGSLTQSLQDDQDRYELQDLLEFDHGTHAVRTGFRFRELRDANSSSANFNGAYTFDTITAYQVTQAGLAAGLTPAQIRADGGGASQFNLTAGQPSALLYTADVGVFAEDDWRITKNLRLSYGLRLESQSAIPDHFNPAPRLALRYAVHHGKSPTPLFTVRGGYGIFYDRFPAIDLLRSVRQNGVTQTAFFVQNPDFFPVIPPPASLATSEPTIYRVNPDLRTSYLQTATFAMDRNLGQRGTVSGTLQYVHNAHNYLTRNINAPLPGTYNPADPASGVRPQPGAGNIYQYSADANGNTERFFVRTSFQFSKRINGFGLYSVEKDLDDTDGIENFPANQYNVGADYGRIGIERKQSFRGGFMCTLPFGVELDPFLAVQSGAPFDITIGADNNGDTIFNDRPAFATDLTRASVVRTAFGNFDTSPIAGQSLIPRNFGTSPGLLWIDLRVSRDIHLGPRPNGNAVAAAGGTPDGKVERPWDLKFSVEAQNLTNHNNPGLPVGVLSSPYFGHSLSLANDYSPLTASNRTILLGTSFTF